MQYLSLLFSVLLSFSLAAQSHVLVRGTITNSKTGKPVGYAHVGIPEKGIGTTSAHNGRFALKIPRRYENSTIIISFIGYETYKRPIKELLRKPVNIKLTPTATELTEVVVMEESAVENIIRKAVKKIPKNYAKHPTNVLAFYRESRTNGEGEYIYLAEGVLNMYKKSYRSKKEGQVALDQGRQVILVSSDEFAEKSQFSSGHMAGHRFDIVKNREDFINEDYFEAYKYWIKGITSYNNHPVYIIGFDQQDGHKDGRMKGEVFIDTTSYAIIRAKFEILPEGLKKWDDYPLYAGSWKANSYIANYRKIGDRWYFSDALREGLYRDGGVYSNEILITENNTKRGKVLPYKERLRRHSDFLDLTGSYDENFWAAYNTVPLSEELEKNVQTKTNEKAAEVFSLENMAEIQRQRDSIQTAKNKAEIEERKAAGLPVPEENATDVLRKAKKFRMRFRNSLSAGVLQIPSGGDNYNITYFDPSDNSPVLTVNNDLRALDYEYLLQYNLNIHLKKHLFFRFGKTWEFGRSIYKERSLGLGTEFNLSKGRPFFVRAGVDYSRLFYARRIGQFANDATFEADDKTFNAEKINVYYGSRTQNIRGFFELSVEANPVLEVFVRGTYSHPIFRQQHIYLWERGDFFRKKVRLPLDDQILVEKNNVPFTGAIMPQNPIFLQIGVILK